MTSIFDENQSTMGTKPNNNITKRKTKPLQDRTNSKNAIFSPKGKMQKKTATTKKRPNTTQLQPRPPASRRIVPKNPTATIVIDIDKNDREDPLAATEYVNEVYQELRKREIKMSPKPNYIGMQPKLVKTHVFVLIDWLIEVQTRYGGQQGLSRETLYLSTNLIHNFLAKHEAIGIDDLQLLGITAFFIASKYEDIVPPLHSDLEALTANAYNSQDFLDMEVKILKTLDYRVSAPTAINFLPRFLKAAGATKEMTHIANYILDGTLLSYNALEFLPSEQAAAAVYIANRKATGYPRRAPWDSTLEHHTGYSQSQVMKVANSIMNEAGNIPKNCESVRNKYDQDKYGNLSSKFTFTF